VKIILTQEVSGLGSPGDVVEVKDGYGRNYLLPQRFAIGWTRGAEKQVSLIKRARDTREIRDLGHAKEVKAGLESLKVSLTAGPARGGRLFGSVTPTEVVAAVKAAGGPQLDRRRVELPGHIKSVGAYEVQVKLHPEVTAKIAVTVTGSRLTRAGSRVPGHNQAPLSGNSGSFQPGRRTDHIGEVCHVRIVGPRRRVCRDGREVGQAYPLAVRAAAQHLREVPAA